MGRLEAMGITVQRTAGKDSTGIAFKLPKPSRVKATFTKEGAGAKVAKLFSRELQTGDADFDAQVYIKTDTAKYTEELLGLAGVREAIANIVDAGGTIHLDAGSVNVELPGENADDSDVATIARELLGIAEGGFST